LSEQQLIKKAKNGDNDAFSEIMSIYQKRIYNYALKTVGNSDDALDISQEIFLRLYSAIKNFREQSAFSTYLFRIMANCCNDFLKSKRKTSTIPIYNEDEEGNITELNIKDEKNNPETEYQSKELKTLINEAINYIDEDFKRIFILKHINNLSYEEIAEILHIEIGTVKSRLYRAREKIKGYIIKNGNNYSYFKSK